jgi:hypothetical protein
MDQDALTLSAVMANNGGEMEHRYRIGRASLKCMSEHNAIREVHMGQHC